MRNKIPLFPMKRYFFLLILPLIIFAEPAYVPVPVHEHYSKFIKAHKQNRVKEVFNEGRYLTQFYKYSPFTKDCFYYLGITYFNIGRYRLADKHLSTYLRSSGMTLKYLQEAIDCKMSIAKVYTDRAFQPPFNNAYLLNADKIYRNILSLAGDRGDVTQVVQRRFEIANILEKKGYTQGQNEEYLDAADRIYVEITTNSTSDELVNSSVKRRFDIASHYMNKGLSKKLTALIKFTQKSSPLSFRWSISQKPSIKSLRSQNIASRGVLISYLGKVFWKMR